MKKIILLISIVSLAIACKKKEAEPFKKKPEPVSEGMQATVKTPEELGESIFTGKGNCTSCHQIDTKTIGPSVHEIAKIYKEQNGDIVKFLKGEGEAIVDPSQFEVMKANFAITKALSDEELKGLEAYIYSK
ncbi:c-type cytochrome [Flavobacterium sp. UMI-01]|uniref:c-type cytochrome n=1 Tax=Flavobacterium sp. UMI-01 TaxID=1441053 RepID=UPI001C7D839A|nr:c-type cytochrome [Flavobacterium sp. UMI-01]GIZ07873.1 cytochrome c552 [Flavobacterium sp. UMI-01]